MSNSKMVVYTKLSPNCNSPRNHAIDTITIHCVVGQLSAESICGCFASPTRQASCNYGIGFDGRISKLMMKKNGVVVVSYERGWDIEPADEASKAAFEAICEKYN